MKVFYENKEIFELDETQKKVIKNDIPSSIFEKDMARRINYWIKIPVHKVAHHHYATLVSQLRERGEKTLPTNKTDVLFRHCNLFPSSLGFDDLNPVKVQCGKISFDIECDYLKAWRKILEGYFKKNTTESSKILEDLALQSRIKWILLYKYERCLERLKNEWIPKLEAEGISSIPLEDREICHLIFSHPNYKDRESRD